jgi:probable rRNA maturation factor
MLEVELLGHERLTKELAPQEITALCTLGVTEGHVAVEFVDQERIAVLNSEHRGKGGPTDVLSFPIDLDEPLGDVQRELGDVVICEAHTEDLREAIIHGVLHLVGMDHETDDGEMLALQAELLDRVRSNGAR